MFNSILCILYCLTAKLRHRLLCKWPKLCQISTELAPSLCISGDLVLVSQSILCILYCLTAKLRHRLLCKWPKLCQISTELAPSLCILEILSWFRNQYFVYCIILLLNYAIGYYVSGLNCVKLAPN